MTFEEWEEFSELNEGYLRGMCQDWKAERVKLIEALEDIANSSHQTYDGKDGQYGIGVADGHRCAANIARAVLEEVKGPSIRGSKCGHM